MPSFDSSCVYLAIEKRWSITIKMLLGQVPYRVDPYDSLLLRWIHGDTNDVWGRHYES